MPKYKRNAFLGPYSKLPDIDAYIGLPFQPYPHYERITPRDLVEELDHLWENIGGDECIPPEYEGLSTLPPDEIEDWRNHQKKVSLSPEESKRLNKEWDRYRLKRDADANRLKHGKEIWQAGGGEKWYRGSLK